MKLDHTCCSGPRSSPVNASSLQKYSLVTNLPKALKSFQVPKKQPPGTQGEGHKGAKDKGPKGTGSPIKSETSVSD